MKLKIKIGEINIVMKKRTGKETEMKIKIIKNKL